MEPDPSLFMRAIRRETLSPELFGAGIASGASQIHMARAAEALAQLIVRHERLPELLRGIRDRQLDAAAMLRARIAMNGMPAVEALDRAIAACGGIAAEPGEADIALHDALTHGIAEGLRALRESGLSADDTRFVSALCQDLCAIETTLRDAYALALEQVKGPEAGAIEATPPFPEPSPDRLTSYLRRRFPAHPALQAGSIQRLVGDNSKDIFLLQLSGAGDLDGAYVMRREPNYNVTQATLANEYALMRHLYDAGVPVPQPLLGEGDTSHFGGGFIITRRVAGAARTAANLGPAARDILKAFARHSAQIHRVSIPTDLPQFADHALRTRERMLAKVDNMYRRWQDERSEDSVIMEAAHAWLHANVDCLDDTPVLTHGDYNLRNVLLEGDRVSSILDWELCRVSHPAEDVSYIRADVEQVMPWDDYLAEYHAHSPHRIGRAALRYFEVWTEFWRTTIGASVYSGYPLGKHRGFLWLSVACVEYRIACNNLARLVAQGPADH